jgi:NAD(P)-dependent dehydrogenase (short-subunit alcohol dehydrogenase family)
MTTIDSSTAPHGSTALVTGSTSGIGRATAEKLASLGVHVIVSGRHTDRGEEVVRVIRAAGGKADFVAAELSDAASARSLAGRALSITGKIDILVNNAGIYTFGATDQMTETDFDAAYDINVKVPYFLVAELAPKMAETGKGSIVNIATGVAHKGFVGASLYGSSKAAIILLTKSWAAEFGPSGVRVNAVSPGPIYTPGTEVMGEGAIDTFAVGTPAARVGEAHEIASAVAFLVSDDAAYIHGAILPVDGGSVAV